MVVVISAHVTFPHLSKKKKKKRSFSTSVSEDFFFRSRDADFILDILYGIEGGELKK